jgi:fructose-1,6-bisphosphatase/sedoheptulose 1,7-bisphosphatase-like protein
MAGIHITDIESAIDWWCARSPSADGITACAQVRAGGGGAQAALSTRARLPRILRHLRRPRAGHRREC